MNAHRSLVALLAVSLLSGTGCSWFSVHGPPDDHEALTSFQCTEDWFSPTADALVAALGVVGIIVGAHAEGGDDWPWVGAFWGGAATVGFFGSSSVVGFLRVSRCRDAKRDLELRIGDDAGG